MQGSASILIIPVAAMAQAPTGFQDYVKRFFVEKNIFGQPCKVAFQPTAVSYDLHNPRPTGVAPGHASEMGAWSDGLPKGKRLWEWVNEQVQAGIFWKFSAQWDDGCGGSYDD